MKHEVSLSGKHPRGMAFLALTQVLALGVALPSVRGYAADTPVAGQRSERKVNLDFVQADINDVAKALAVQSGVNVVLMPSVKGNVTVRLTGVSPEEALKKMAAAVASDVRRLDGTYYLGSTTELRAMAAQSGARTTIALKHVQAADVKEVLVAAWPYLTVEAAGKSNTLVLAGMVEDIQGALTKVRDLDVAAPEPPKVEPPAPVMVRETYIVKHARVDQLVDTLAKACPELKVSNVERTLVLEGTRQHQDSVAKLLAALDTPGSAGRIVRAYRLKYLHPNQAMMPIKAHFPNLTVSAGFESYSPPRANFKPLSSDAEKALSTQGLSSTQTTTSSSAGGAGGAGAAVDVDGVGSRARVLILAGPKEEVEQATEVLSANDVAPQQVLIEAKMVDMSPERAKQLGFLYDWSSFGFTESRRGAQTYEFGKYFRAPFNWSATLEAMETSRDAKILAKPNIAVIDSEEASIFIGDILRYERLESNTAAGQTFTIETVPVGVALLCRPRVNDGGEITLRVHPVVSTVSGFTGRNKDIPITSSREAESIIRMKDGETVAIGGLLREEDIKTMTKVPILGDLPFLGNLFKHRNSSHRKSEVTIFITVRILKN